MYKLIVTDIDGTLLDDQSRISRLNLKALQCCLENGLQVLLATGKSIHTITEYIDMLGLTLPQITLNGGVIFQPQKGVIEAHTLEEKDYLDLVRAIKGYGLSPTSALADGRVIYETYDPHMVHIQNAQVDLIQVEDMEQPSIAKNAISVHTPIREDHPADGYLREQFGSRFFIVRSGEYFFDFLKIGINKGNALKKILAQQKIKRQEVVVLGDSFNDLSLFEVGGLSIAMSNSFPEVMAQADIVAGDNNHSGLGKAIFKYVLGKDVQPVSNR